MAVFLHQRQIHMNLRPTLKWIKRYFLAISILVIPFLILFELAPIKDVVPIERLDELSSREEWIYDMILTCISLWGSLLLGRAQCLNSFDDFSRDQCRRLNTIYAGTRKIAIIANAMVQTMKSDEDSEPSSSNEIWLGLGGILTVSESLRRQLLDCLVSWSDYASDELELAEYRGFVSTEKEEMENGN